MPISLNDIQQNTGGPRKNKGSNKKNSSSWSNFMSKEIGGNKLKDSFKESFYGELGLLLEAGMNIKSALDLIQEQQKKDKHKEKLSKITENLTQGARFSEILEQEDQFTAYEQFSISIGEETGNLVEILKRLSAYYNQKIQQRRSIIGALTYPAVILFTAVLAVTFMLTYMVPLFEDIFARMGGDLPWLTQIIIDFSNSFGTIALVTLIAIGVFITIHVINRKSEKYKSIFYKFLLGIPIVGNMMKQTYTLRLVQSLSLLISSKVPITEALDLSEKMVRFHPISSSLKQIQKNILQGMSLNEGMSKFSIYSKRMVSLVKVGEESNQLSLIFAKLANQMEDELEYRAKVLGNTIEPIIIIFLGFFVAVILVAMYLPMFQLSTSIGF